MLSVVQRKPGETRTAVCGAVMDITLEAYKQTKGKLRYQLHLFHVTPTAASVYSTRPAVLHTCTHGMRA
jgi:hypothetical protein